MAPHPDLPAQLTNDARGPSLHTNGHNVSLLPKCPLQSAQGESPTKLAKGSQPKVKRKDIGHDTRKCDRCRKSERDLGLRAGKGEITQHQLLCFGVGIGAPNSCTICGKLCQAPSSLVKHFENAHTIDLEQVNIEVVTIRMRAEDYPRLDLSNSFGMRYTRRSVTSPTWDQEISGFWKLYTTNTAEFEGEHHLRCQSGYIEDFESFFGSLPAVMTTHVSDITPQTVHSLLQRLASYRLLTPFPPLPFKGLQNTAPTFACTPGVHGSSYGQGASVNPKNRTFACGPPYITLPKTATTLFKIVTALRKAKKNGCIALLTEIVCWDNGVPVTPNNWSLLIQACAKVGLPMIADETLSAIRCGAPWAYQRPEYVNYGPPDLVIFGKGMETAGLAINPKGKFFMKYHLNAHEVTNTGLFQTRASFSVWCHPPVLLRSWMVIRAAKEEKWPERSTQIGGILRTFAKDTITKRKHKSELLGLGALIYIRTESAKATATQGAAGAPGWLRWLPTMDDVMADPERLKIQMFGPTSLAHRKLLVKIMEDIGDLPPWCSSCGDFQTGEAFCSTVYAALQHATFALVGEIFTVAMAINDQGP